MNGWLRSLLILCGLSLLSGAWSAHRARELGGLRPLDLVERLERVLKEWRASDAKVVVLEWPESETLGDRRDLFEAKALLVENLTPEQRTLFEAQLGQCPPVKNDPNVSSRNPRFEKYFRLQHLRCHGAAAPKDLLSRPPWISPTGVSFTFEFSHSLSGEKREQFLVDHQATLHVLEKAALPRDRLSAKDAALSTLNLTELAAFNSGIPMIFTATQYWRLIPDRPGATVYELGSRKAADRAFRAQGLMIANASCNIDDCIVESPDRVRFLKIFSGSVAVLVVSLALLAGLLLWQRRQLLVQIQRDRELIMGTLAHELRHPVTSLRITLEVFRDLYEDLSDIGQREFLRMSDQVSRLVRLTEMSSQYIKSTQNDRAQFTPQWARLESFNDYLADVCAPYADRIEVRMLENDSAIEIDPYWFALCVTNLIKNALIHGKLPVVVEPVLVEANLQVRVLDHGTAPRASLEELTAAKAKESQRGLGIGLSLVSRIVQSMGGRLLFHASPKYFALEIPLKRMESPQ